MSFIATQRLFTSSPFVHDAFMVSPPDLSFRNLAFVCHSLPKCLSPLLLSSHKHGPLTPCRPIPILFKLGQSQECTLHTPHHSLAISKSSISIPLGSAPYYSFFYHHHNHNSFKQTVKSNQSIPLSKYIYPLHQQINQHGSLRHLPSRQAGRQGRRLRCWLRCPEEGRCLRRGMLGPEEGRRLRRGMFDYVNNLPANLAIISSLSVPPE